MRRISRAALGALLFATALLLQADAPASAQDGPTKYALVIGLNDFRNLNGRLQPLKFASQDAREVALVLERNGFKVTPLVNGSAKREDIVGELNRLARTVTRDDTFVLFFAGHGVQNASVSETSTYWLTYDARLDAPDVEGIRIDHLMDYVRDIRAGRKLVLLDHCFSGRVGRAAPAASGSLDATQPGARGGGDETLTVARGTEPVPGWASVRPRSTGLVVIGASRELAYEKDGHGLFTAALLAALGSREADVNKDGKLSAAELLMFLPQRMQALATKYQLNQRVEDLVEGQALADWEVVSSLPIDTVQDATAKKQVYLNILTRWVVRNFIPAVLKMRCARVIDKWFASVSSATTLDPNDKGMFDQIRGLLEDSAPEEERARTLVEFVAGTCAANPLSDLCR